MKWRLVAVLMIALAGLPALAEGSAVVFTYHRFGEDRVPATNIRLAQFEVHLRILEEGKFTVWPLSRIIRALRDGTELPDRTVALTADDAYRSVLTEAWPRLQRRGWPMTLFVATDGVDQGYRGYLNWDEIRGLQDQGMEIGAHSSSHAHMAEMLAAPAAADLHRSARRFKQELGQVPTLFAYPYGESGLLMKQVVQQAGYAAAFGQHSGSVGHGMDLYDLPRFAMNEAYGEADRFQLAANSLPLRITEPVPADTLLRTGALPPFGFRLVSDVRPGGLSCFHSMSKGPVSLVVEGDIVRFRVDARAVPGRSRYNCTAQAGGGRWYWHGRQFVTPGGTD